MNLDRTDLKILRIMVDLEKKRKYVTTSNIAKSVFEINKREDYQKKDSLIRKRLGKLVKFGVVDRDNNKVNGRTVSVYSINSEKFIMGNVSMEIDPDFENQKREMKVDNMIFIKNSNGFLIYGHT